MLPLSVCRVEVGSQEQGCGAAFTAVLSTRGVAVDSKAVLAFVGSSEAAEAVVSLVASR